MNITTKTDEIVERFNDNFTADIYQNVYIGEGMSKEEEQINEQITDFIRTEFRKGMEELLGEAELQIKSLQTMTDKHPVIPPTHPHYNQGYRSALKASIGIIDRLNTKISEVRG